MEDEQETGRIKQAYIHTMVPTPRCNQPVFDFINHRGFGDIYIVAAHEPSIPPSHPIMMEHLLSTPPKDNAAATTTKVWSDGPTLQSFSTPATITLLVIRANIDSAAFEKATAIGGRIRIRRGLVSLNCCGRAPVDATVRLPARSRSRMPGGGGCAFPFAHATDQE